MPDNTEKNKTTTDSERSVEEQEIIFLEEYKKKLELALKLDPFVYHNNSKQEE